LEASKFDLTDTRIWMCSNLLVEGRLKKLPGRPSRGSKSKIPFLVPQPARGALGHSNHSRPAGANAHTQRKRLQYTSHGPMWRCHITT